MDPIVQSAWVAAASAFVGILVGVGGTTFITLKSTKETLKARHDERLWDRKANAYQDAMTAALQRHDRRQQAVDTKASPETLDLKVGQEWYDMQGRLRSFGAMEVVTAFEDSMKASKRLDIHHEDTTAGTKEFENDLHHAMTADDALVSAIRRDLGIKTVGTKPNAN
jgi:hypothetical protein